MTRPVNPETPNAVEAVFHSREPVYRDILDVGKRTLSKLERAQIRFVRKTFEPGRLSDAMVTAQRIFGSQWIEVCTRNIRQFHGLDRFPKLAKNDSIILVSNHRSFFDMYVLAGYFVRRGMQQRLLFPVRSKFFYDSPAGLFVNGIMSWFAMYPPIFRERSRAALNVASLDETIRLVRSGGMFLGVHPEGQRNTSDDPYAFLPPQRGVGKIFHECPRAKVVPVFINGLGNDLPKQVRGNFDGKGEPILAVFGEPIDFGDRLRKPSTPKLHRELAEVAMEHVRKLAQEERTYRSLLQS